MKRFHMIAGSGELLEQYLSNRFQRNFVVHPHGSKWRCYDSSNRTNSEITADTLIELEEKVVAEILGGRF